jgi:amino acid transporter
MSEQLASVIEVLSQKLGVAAEYLYPILIRQAYVDGWASIAFIALGIIAILVAIKILRYLLVPVSFTEEHPPIVEGTKEIKTTKNMTRFAAWTTHKDEGMRIITWIMIIPALVMLLFGIIDILAHTENAIKAFGNPEWHAIKQLVDTVSPADNSWR